MKKIKRLHLTQQQSYQLVDAFADWHLAAELEQEAIIAVAKTLKIHPKEALEILSKYADVSDFTADAGVEVHPDGIPGWDVEAIAMALMIAGSAVGVVCAASGVV